MVLDGINNRKNRNKVALVFYTCDNLGKDWEKAIRISDT